MVKHRVVITGLSAIASNGIGKEKFWKATLNGNSGIREISRFDASTYPCRYAGEVRNFDPYESLSPKEVRRMSRMSQLATACSQMAVEDANLELGGVDPHKLGVTLGCTIGPIDLLETYVILLYEKGLKRLSPFAYGMWNQNAVTGAVANRFGAKGYNMTLTSGCSSGNAAIATAFDRISSGNQDLMICGGVDAPIFSPVFATYVAAGLLTTDNSDPENVLRPYDKTRSGFILAEGAGIIVLESLDHALKRGSDIYAEVLGYGITNDATDESVFNPSSKEVIQAFGLALKNSQLSIDEIDVVAGHAHSSPNVDKKEIEAVSSLTRRRDRKIMIYAIKSMIGNALAGSAAIQTVSLALSIKEKVVPPTLNCKDPDFDTDRMTVSSEPVPAEVRTAVVISFGLGGSNVVLALKKFNDIL